MGTSRSSSHPHSKPESAESRGAAPRWCVAALLYSGRENPEWTIPDSLARAAVEVWDGLVPTVAPPVPPPLGPRGLQLIAPDGGRWTSHRGVVTYLPPNASESHSRQDPGSHFHQLLADSAPKGLLP